MVIDIIIVMGFKNVILRNNIPNFDSESEFGTLQNPVYCLTNAVQRR